MNNCMLIGNLGGKPEFKELDAGKLFCSCSVALWESWGKDDAKKDRTDWVRIVAWGALARRMSQASKGDRVLIHGKIRERKWEDKDTKAKRTSHEIEARIFQRIVKERKADSPEPSTEDAPDWASCDQDRMPF